jgi:TRAP-type C4-dicarboxylate transport system permease small subunit
LTKIFKSKALFVARKIILVISIAAMCLLVYHGIALTRVNIPNYLQNVRISLAWFNAAIPVGCFFILGEFLLILIYGRHPFARSSAPPKDPIAAVDAA